MESRAAPSAPNATKKSNFVVVELVLFASSAVANLLGIEGRRRRLLIGGGFGGGGWGLADAALHQSVAGKRAQIRRGVLPRPQRRAIAH